MPDTPDLAIEMRDFVATVEIRRPPHNFFDFNLIRQLADAFEALDPDPACRAIVLCSQGKSFCAGANFGDGSQVQADGSLKGSLNRLGVDPLYGQAVRLVAANKPVVGALQGAAPGRGASAARTSPASHSLRHSAPPACFRCRCCAGK